MAPREQVDLNNFLMDLENWVLEHRWDARIGIPCGRARHLDHQWGEVMREEMADYPRRTYEEYCEWVESGGGDEWFQPLDPELPDQGYIEARAKQRTAYLCRDTVVPLNVTLYDRVVPIALAARRAGAERPAQSAGAERPSLRSAAVVNGQTADNLRRIGQAGG